MTTAVVTPSNPQHGPVEHSRVPRFEIGEEPIAIDDVVAVARDARVLVLGDQASRRARVVRQAVEAAAQASQLAYGINTGVGCLANRRLSEDEQAVTQVALIRSHAAGVGKELPSDVVRAAMFLRATSLSKGYSGVSLEVMQRIVDVLNSEFTPAIPSIGSLGCSGDLVTLAHLAATLFLREGSAVGPDGELVSAAQMHEILGLEPIALRAKEGLSLINGTEFMSAALALAIHDATVLLATADVASGLTRAALLAHSDAVGDFAHALRPHPGQSASAANARELLLDDEFVRALRQEHGVVAPQDPYSVRCTPQVHGAVAGALSHARAVCTVEINSCTDNPALDLADGQARVVSHGNFHGAPLAYAADYLKVVLADLASLSERRTNRLIDEKLSRGLPPFLTSHPGPNSGFMIAHYTMAGLVNRMKARGPNSTDSIPTSAGWEDHVSMGWNACLALRETIQDLAHVIGTELLIAAEGVRIRGIDSALPPALSAAMRAVEMTSAPLTDDRILSEEMILLAERASAGDFAPQAFVDRYTRPSHEPFGGAAPSTVTLAPVPVGA
jgi:histidine ammonia-lyase